MLISQTVDFLNIHENLHRLIMEIKLSTQLSRSNESRLKIQPYHLMEGTWGYNTVILNLKIKFENFWKWKIAIFAMLMLFDFDDIPTEGGPQHVIQQWRHHNSSSTRSRDISLQIFYILRPLVARAFTLHPNFPFMCLLLFPLPSSLSPPLYEILNKWSLHQLTVYYWMSTWINLLICCKMYLLHKYLSKNKCFSYSPLS
jgi:hypothetical protein